MTSIDIEEEGTRLLKEIVRQILVTARTFTNEAETGTEAGRRYHVVEV